jgi:hypothetical protein
MALYHIVFTRTYRNCLPNAGSQLTLYSFTEKNVTQFFLKRIHDFDCAIQLLNDEFLIEFLAAPINLTIKRTVKSSSSNQKVRITERDED